jgi:hypothetical protein
MKFHLKDKIMIFFFSLLLLLTGINKINNFQDYNSTVIVENHEFNSKKNQELFKGDKVIGEFIAKNDHLGTISIKFNTHNRVNNDYLMFRIKQDGSNHWYYNNRYKVDQFQNDKYFPFGFSQINNSKDKKYQIEIESLGGVKGNSVEILVKDSPFLSKYSFPKTYLQQNKKEIPMFIFGKVKSYFNHIDLKVFLALLIINILSIFLLRLININKLIDRFKKLKKLKDNKFINPLLITVSICGLFVINLLINGPIRLKAFIFADDLGTWNFFNSNRNNFFSFIFNTAANKFRPVFYSAFFAILSLIGNNIWLFGVFLLIFNFFIAIILFLLFCKISKNIIISLCLSIAFILSRFAYYDITQAIGLMEAMALLFSVFMLYLLWRYLNTEKIKYFWISVVVFLLLLLTHERFVTLLFLYLVTFLFLKRTSKRILLFFISTLPIIFIWGLKIFVLQIRPLDGTGGTDILQTFNITNFLQFLLSGWQYLFGINAGPAYLNGISSESVPQNINHLILIGCFCLLFIFILFGLLVLKNRKIFFKKNINNFILFFSFIFLTLIAASVTFRLEMRWLYVPFVGLLFLLAYIFRVVLKQSIIGKFCLFLIVLWLCMIVQIDIFYRSNYKNLYYWSSQTFGNSLYEATLEKYGNDSWNYKIYVVCAEKTSSFTLGCTEHGDLNLFFKQFEKKGVKTNLYLINKVSKILPITKGSKILVLMYDQQRGKFVNLKPGSELRKAILKSGWYGWNGNVSIWTGPEAEALFQTGDKGYMVFKGFLPKYNLPNTVTLFIDDKLVSRFYIEESNIKFQIETPKNRIIDLKLTTDNYKSPATMKIGDDVRELGILVTDIKFE